MSWDEDYDELKKNHENFIAYFDKNRVCKCDIEICSHLRDAEKTLFNKKYDGLVQRKILEGINTLFKNVPEFFKIKKE